MEINSDSELSIKNVVCVPGMGMYPFSVWATPKDPTFSESGRAVSAPDLGPLGRGFESR